MGLDADYLLDRRALKRRVIFWRWLAITVAIGFITFTFWDHSSLQLDNSHIKSLQINGTIYHDKDRVLAIEKARDNPSVKALIIEINSPGGTVIGGETLYEAIRYFAHKKPVVAIMGDVATSAGYMAAIAAEKIYAQKATITGSIGVLFQTAEITEFLEKLGITVEAVKSTPLKGSPSLLEKVTPEARKSKRLIVEDMSNMFIRMVADRRNISIERARTLADGRVYTGQMALRHGLIDAIGGRKKALKWLKNKRNIPDNLPIFNLQAATSKINWLKHIQSLTQKVAISDRLMLDGLLSIWQPSAR